MGAIYLCLLAAQIHHMDHGAMATPDELSLFNHRLAGVLVILLGVITYAEESRLGRSSWVRYLWPLPLLGLGTYLLIRSDGELPWPFRLHLWLHDMEAVQHKIFALIALSIGGIELLRRTGHLQQAGWRYMFYGIMFGGGLFLLFHRGVQHSHVVHLQHMAMGTVAIGVTVVKTLSDIQSGVLWLRLYLLPSLLLLLGFQLVLYVE